MAKASKLDELEPHLSKCFEGMSSLYMKDKTTSNSIGIYGMVSPEGEILPFVKAITARGNVELWLDLMQKEMIEAMRKHIKQGF